MASNTLEAARQSSNNNQLSTLNKNTRTSLLKSMQGIATAAAPQWLNKIKMSQMEAQMKSVLLLISVLRLPPLPFLFFTRWIRQDKNFNPVLRRPLNLLRQWFGCTHDCHDLLTGWSVMISKKAGSVSPTSSRQLLPWQRSQKQFKFSGHYISTRDTQQQGVEILNHPPNTGS